MKYKSKVDIKNIIMKNDDKSTLKHILSASKNHGAEKTKIIASQLIKSPDYITLSFANHNHNLSLLSEI